jgi:1-aminocyclopropane-1-carboxylate deaminase/D-cysteine desulfhydrase-like pyridoxal-dependent ACC family enzyme
MDGNTIPLFKLYPGLSGKLPWISLGRYPTPVQHLKRLGGRLGLNQLWIKRDDLTSPDYGGNKVRKLEFILADAKGRKRDSVISLGAACSNFVLATTVHSRAVGLRNIAVMMPQRVQEYCRKNLLSNYNLGCELHYAESQLAVPWVIIRTYLDNRDREKGSRPYLIWFGGSSALGVLGYVNCGLEIAEQVKAGEMPEPDYIFCAVGSAGTISGLWLGCRLAGLRAEVTGVRVFDYIGANEYMVAHFARSALKLLRKHDPGIPDIRIDHRGFHMLHEYFGKGYAHFTRLGVESVELMHELENISLDGTYTGKAMAGLAGFAKDRGLQDKVFLFLDSYSSSDLSGFVNINPDYHRLPEGFHQYFEKEIAAVEEC